MTGSIDPMTLAAALFPLRSADFRELRYADRPDATATYMGQVSARRPPLAVLFHGGGWVKGDPARNIVLAAPLLLAGWAVANVRYRLACDAPAPAAVEDAVAAIDALFADSDPLGFDPARVVPIGVSAGGHLALCAGLAPELFDARPRPHRVAAIINLYGVAEPAELLTGDDRQAFASVWLAGADAELQRRLSAVEAVRHGVFPPPVFSAHGKDDRIVPFRQSMALHAALEARGADHRLLELRGDHGRFDEDERVRMFAGMRSFLHQRGLWPGPRG